MVFGNTDLYLSFGSAVYSQSDSGQPQSAICWPLPYSLKLSFPGCLIPPPPHTLLIVPSGCSCLLSFADSSSSTWKLVAGVAQGSVPNPLPLVSWLYQDDISIVHCSIFHLINSQSLIAWPHLLLCWDLIAKCVATSFNWMFPSISDITYPKLNSGSSTLIRSTPQRRPSPSMHILSLAHIILHPLSGAMSWPVDFISALTLHDLSQSCPFSVQNGHRCAWPCWQCATTQWWSSPPLTQLTCSLWWTLDPSTAWAQELLEEFKFKETIRSQQEKPLVWILSLFSLIPFLLTTHLPQGKKKKTTQKQIIIPFGCWNGIPNLMYCTSLKNNFILPLECLRA